MEQTRYVYNSPTYLDGPSEIHKWLGGVDYAVTKYEYDEYGKNTLTIDPLGNTAILKYDGYGNVLETIQAKNYVDTLDYDIVSITKNGYSGSLLKHTEIQDADENVLDMTVNFYDELKRLRNTAKIDVSVISNFDNVRNAENIADLPENNKHVITAYHYTGNDLQPDWIEDAAGAKTYFAYDDNGRQKYSYYESEDRYIFSVNVYDSLGRIIQSEQIIDDETPYSGEFERRLLSRTKYNTSGKVEYSISDSNNLTKYEYDIIGNVVETRTYNIADIAWDNHEVIAGYINSPNNVLTISRTLYDTEGRAIVNVGPYAPNVYQQPMSDWPAGTETVYDVLGRAIETRRWAGVKIDLVPFKLSSSGEPIICSADDEGMLGKMTPPGVYTSNALTYSSTEPDNIGWTSNDKLAVAAQSIDSDEIGPLSYSRTIYDLAGGVLHSVSLDENGYEQLTSYEYDLAGRQTAVIDPLGHKIDNLYTAGIVLNNASITNAAKVNFNNFDYNNYDPIYHPNGNFTGTHRTVTDYDGSRRDSVTDAMGNTISFDYDSLGRVIRTNYPATVQNPQTYVHTKYDGLGRKYFESQQTAEINPDNAVGKTFEYDIAGRLIKVILPTVGDGTPEYRYFYDTFGNMVGILDPLNRMTVFEYDALNRQIAKFMPFDFTDPTGGEITVDYIYESIPAEQKYQMSFYDDFGRIEYSADYKEQITSYEYDSRGRLEYKKYYLNETDYTADEPDAVVQYVYDSLGRKEQIIDSRHGITTYYYDAEGSIISVVSPEGTVNYSYNSITGQKVNTNSARTDTQYFYDELGRLQGTSTASEDVYYHYDDNGNRKWQCIDTNGGFNYSDPENPSGYEIKTDYTYDSLNRLTDLIHKKADLTTLSDYSYSLKADGSRQSVNESLQEDRNITYGYDNLNRLLSETAVSDENGYGATYTYDLAGNRLLREVIANGQILNTEYQYYPGTDKLYKEIHTGPIAALDSGDERYYAYGGSGGNGFYYRDSRGNAVSSLKAYFIGLPVVWSKYVFMAVLILSIILFFLPNVIFRRSRRELSFFHRGMCVLLAWVMFISPEMFNQLSDAAVDYAQLGTSTWGKADREIIYTYDDNGSLKEKRLLPIGITFPFEVVDYTYDAANRLIKVVVSPSRYIKNYVEYTYNDDGIRVSAYSYTTNYSGPPENEKTVIYLTDSYNHTGYSQALEELTFNKAAPDLQADTPDSVRTYLLGDDVIAQRTSGNTQYLLYDGHGSTRQLASYNGTDVTIADDYSYDGYGVFLQPDYDLNDDGVKTPQQQTSLLYAGEHFDFNSQQYYNRARWYNPLSGLFNQVDPYAGNLHDPQSLHKYLYCHANPINATDPSGEEATLTNVLATSSIIGAVMCSITGYIRGGVSGAISGAVAGAIFAPLMTLGVLGAGIGLAAVTGISAVTGLMISFSITVVGSLIWNIYNLITAKNERERLASGVALIFTIGCAVFGAYQFSKVPSLPSNASNKGSVLPQSKGALGRFLSEAAAGFRGERVIAKEVTVKTQSGVKVRVDLVVKTISGKIKFIESKNGPNSSFTPNQKIAYPEISQTGGTIVGNNGSSAGFPNGTTIGPTSVQVDVWNGAAPGNL